MARYLSLFSLLFCINTVGWMQLSSHVATLNLNRQGAANNFTIVGNAGDVSTIFESDFSTASNEHMKLHRINNVDNFKLIFNVEEDATSIMSFGFSEFNTDNKEYKFVISPSNGVSKFTIVAPGYTSALMDYDNASVFEIAKCFNTISFFLNGTVLKNVSFDSNVNRYEVYLHPQTVNDIDFFVSTSTENECSVPNTNLYYAVLNTEIPTTHTAIIDNTIRVLYVEKFAIDPAVNGLVKWKLLVDNSVINSGTFNNIYGINKHSIPLSNTAFRSAILKVEGVNKNETLYLKFKGSL